MSKGTGGNSRTRMEIAGISLELQYGVLSEEQWRNRMPTIKP